jgi:long-chain acyl-CoA synthetase
VPGPARQFHAPKTAPRRSGSRASRSAVARTGPTYADRPWVASYPAGVPADFDFPMVPLTRLLDDAASSFPTRTALAFLGTTLTYRELKDAVDRFATGLKGLGVGKGDRVAIVLPNCPQNVIAFFAALRLGAVVVQHNPLYTEAELRHQLADCGATVAVCLDKVWAAVEKVRPDTALQHVVVTSIADYLPASSRLKLRLPIAKARKARAEITASIPHGAPVRQFLAMLKTSDPARQVPLDPEQDLALLQYTGGTTGLSKGAMLTHANLVSNAYMNRLWDTGATAGKEVTLAVLPLFHAYGLTVAMNATILLGGTLVLLPRFDIDQVFSAIDQWKPTMFPGVPPIYKALSDSPKAKAHDLRSIRLCVSGAMKLPLEIQEQFERISGCRLVEGYGMTETSPSTHCNPVSGLRKPGTIGVPLPGTTCKIVAQDDPSAEVPVGEPGELAVSGPQVFRGYWGRDELTGIFTDDGYVLTGDVAVMDEDGFFTIVDRKKELIIAGGFNIYPSEVEEVLFRLPGVADAVVVGLPDKYRGETVKAYVVAQPGAELSEQDVLAHCRQELTAYKVPKVVEFRDSLPRTVVGKVLRRVLVEEERAKAEAAAPTAPAKRPAARKPARKEAPATKPAAKKAPVKKAAAKQTAKQAPAKKTAAQKAPAKKAPAKKTAAPTSAPAVPTPPATVQRIAPRVPAPGARKTAAPPRRST